VLSNVPTHWMTLTPSYPQAVSAGGNMTSRVTVPCRRHLMQLPYGREAAGNE